MSKILNISSDKIVISDPIQKIPSWCQAVVPAKSGDWETSAKMTLAGKIISLSAWHIDSAMDNNQLPDEVLKGYELPYIFMVTSGSFGYFDSSQYPGESIPVSNGEYKTTGVKDSNGKYIALSTTFIKERLRGDEDDTDDDEDEEEEIFD